MCKEKERQALLALKKDFADPIGELSSWSSGANHADCCIWEGVRCNHQTGHVVELDIRGWALGGIVNPSLHELHHLIHLDLSDNYFNLSHIQPLLGSLTNLKYLGLSRARLQGQIPLNLGNLSHLENLDLSYNSLDGEFPTQICNLSKLVHLDLGGNHFTGKVPNLGNLTSLQYLALGRYGYYDDDMPITSLRSNLEWLFHLKFLKSLQIYHIDLSGAYNWLQQVTNLIHLQELILSESNLQDNVLRSFSSINITWTTLAAVDLSYNNLTSSVYKSFFDICSLRQIDLSGNKLSGQLAAFIPTSIHRADKALEELSLSMNEFTGSVPNLSAFPSLRYVNLGDNNLNGTVSESISELSKMEMFSVRYNSLQGVISKAHFSKLLKLSYLDLSFNALVFDDSSDSFPPQLESLYLASCKLGPHFPRWLRTQKNIQMLDISSTTITNPIPNWFWDLYPNLVYLNLSHNHISGEIPNLSLKYNTFALTDLSSNKLQGRIPSFLSSASWLDLSNNMFSKANSLICSNKTKHLRVLDLSNNQITGKLPECWTHFESLVFLNLANNRFSGADYHSKQLLVGYQVIYLYLH